MKLWMLAVEIHIIPKPIAVNMIMHPTSTIFPHCAFSLTWLLSERCFKAKWIDKVSAISRNESEACQIIFLTTEFFSLLTIDASSKNYLSGSVVVVDLSVVVEALYVGVFLLTHMNEKWKSVLASNTLSFIWQNQNHNLDSFAHLSPSHRPFCYSANRHLDTAEPYDFLAFITWGLICSQYLSLW